MSSELCLCESKKPYQYCCGLYLSGKKQPETAEKSMRSRYTAFHQGNVDYLIATLHPDQRKPDDQQELAKSIRNTQWLGLKIIDTHQGKKKDTKGIVEFEAVYHLNKPGQLHERSRFIQTQGKWFYVDGDILPGTIPKPKEPCWCRNGMQYKQCHGI
jgi:SEC-C motif-containing protein